MTKRSSGFAIGVAFASGLVIGILLPRPWQKEKESVPPPAQSTVAPETATGFETLVAAGNKAQDEKRHRDAVAAYDRALAIRFDPNVATDRGVALRDLGETDVALAAFEFVLLRVPTHWQARYNRAAVLLQLGRIDEARVEAERLAAEHGDNPSVMALQSAIQKNARQ